MPTTITVPTRKEIDEVVCERFEIANLVTEDGRPDHEALADALTEVVMTARAANIGEREGLAIPIGSLMKQVMPDLAQPGSNEYQNSVLAQEVWKNVLARVNTALKIKEDGGGAVESRVRRRVEGCTLLRIRVPSTAGRGAWGFYITNDPTCLIEDDLEVRTDAARIRQDNAAKRANFLAILQPDNAALYADAARKKLNAGTTRAIASLNAASNGNSK